MNDSQLNPSPRGLPHRSNSEEDIPALSFEVHRRQRSRSREPSNLRHAASAESLRHVEPLVLLNTNHRPLTTLKEVASTSNTPVEDVNTELPQKVEVDLEKRLPTLPNTPSSAYPPSLMAASPERGLDLDVLNSHFSATTIDTDYYPLNTVLEGKSRFSTWTTNTENLMVSVDNSIPLPTILQHEKTQRDHPDLNNDGYLPSSMSLASICSSISTTPSTSFIDTDAEFDTFEKNAGSKHNRVSRSFQHYRLPADEYTSAITLKAPLQDRRRGRSPGPLGEYRQETHQGVLEEQDLGHSESMQKLLDELSYLSDMIQL